MQMPCGGAVPSRKERKTNKVGAEHRTGSKGDFFFFVPVSLWDLFPDQGLNLGFSSESAKC